MGWIRLVPVVAHDLSCVLSTRFQTPVAKSNVNPTYLPKDATFDFPILLSLAGNLGAKILWDKDMLSKDYLGEVAIPLEDWLNNGSSFAFNDLNNKVSLYSCTLLSVSASDVQPALQY